MTIHGDADRGRIEAWEGCPPATWQRRWDVPELHLYGAIGSTNDIARARAEDGAPTGTIVLADEQVAGRGRRGRGWIADPGQAILMSCIFRLDGNGTPDTAPLRVGLATATAIENATGLRCQIKWPNDLLADGRKLGGILCESGTAAGKGWLVAGTGINVHQRHDDFPPDIRDHATSVAAAAGFDVDRAELTGRIIAALKDIADIVATPLDPGALATIQERDALHGRAIAVDGRPAGTGHGIAGDGSLLVRDHHGTVRTLRSGTIRIIEPTQTGTP